MKRLARRIFVFLSASAALLALAVPKARSAERPPNFIIFIADDMAWNDCGAYGHPHIRTPHIDQLAHEGLRFDRAFLTTSSCSPSRASILTGRYPHSTGAEQLHWPLPGDQLMFSQVLRNAGYHTASAGKWHLGGPAKKQFDVVQEGRGNPWLQVLKDRPRDKPFFLWLAFYDPHRGYSQNAIPQPHTGEDAVVPPFLPDVPATRDDLAMYYDEIARLDGVVGEVLAELKQQQADQDTLVLFMSDNGRPFPRCKTTLYDSGIRTPFIIRFPGRVKPGSTSDSLVSAIDVAPTLCELAGLDSQPTFQGKSFSKVLEDPRAQTREYIFAEHNWHDYAANDRGCRSANFKYILNAYTDLPGTPPADAVRSPTFVAMRRLRDAGMLPAEQMGPFVKPRADEELYDLSNDPYELHNLAGMPKYQDALATHRAALQAWQKRTGDARPQERSPDEFDRETGQRLKDIKFNRSPRPELESRPVE